MTTLYLTPKSIHSLVASLTIRLLTLGFTLVLVFSGCASSGEEERSELITTLRACGTDERPLRIMPLGDSITESKEGYSSYRRPLYQLLRQTGCTIDLVGSKSGVSSGFRDSPSVEPPNADFDQDHEGHWDYTTGDVRERIEEWFRANTPDIVLIHLGTNDVLRGRPIEEPVANLTAIIETVRLIQPEVRIALAQTIPTESEPEETRRLNERIAALAVQLTTDESPIRLVDQWTNFSSEFDTFDGLHPDPSGERKIASNFANSVTEFVAEAQ